MLCTETHKIGEMNFLLWVTAIGTVTPGWYPPARFEALVALISRNIVMHVSYMSHIIFPDHRSLLR